MSVMRCEVCYYYYADGEPDGHPVGRPYCHFDGDELPWDAPCEDDEHRFWIDEEQ